MLIVIPAMWSRQVASLSFEESMLCFGMWILRFETRSTSGSRAFSFVLLRLQTVCACLVASSDVVSLLFFRCRLSVLALWRLVVDGVSLLFSHSY